jgi:predicted alpha/beta-fold hydrolase
LSERWLGHWQTIVAALFPPPRLSLERRRWEAPDGDFVDVDFAGPPAGSPLVLLHGLEGSSDSHYARNLAARFGAAGRRVAIPHWRGCSGEPNRLARAYHSGDSDELDWLLARLPGRVDVLGVSLGGNVLLKWLGERGEGAAERVRRAAAVSAPLDLAAAARALDRGLNRLLYTRMFLDTLKPKSLAKLARFPGLYDAARLERAKTFREFDDLVTAPVHGFRDAEHYWRESSSGRYLAGIRVPTLLLNARNDPFLPEPALLAAAAAAARCVQAEFPRHGGHVGFRPDWLARRLMEFFETK